MKKPHERPTRPFRNVKGQEGKLIESLRRAYNPDAEFSVKLTDALVPKFYKNLTGKSKPDLVESANVIEVNRFGAYRIRKINGSQDFRTALSEAEANRSVLSRIIESGVKLREASKFTIAERDGLRHLSESKKFREDFAVSSNNTQDPFNEYIPLMGGPFSHQLYLHDFLDMLAKAFEAWNHNPLAHQIVKITTHFVLGRGVTYKARDPIVQKRFEQWWDKNEMSTRLEFWSDMLSRDGELMIRRFINPITKQMFVRWVDPSTIWEVVTDLEDIETVYYYHQQYPTAFQVLYGADKNAKFNPTNFGSSKYIINQIPADEMHHVKINCSPNEKRGRTDFFSILGWLKRYKDFQTAVVLRSIIQATFAWKNKLTGTNTDVDAFISAFGTDQPEFGSVWVENEASDLQPMTANTSTGGALADCPGIVNAIATGSGVPKEYLGLSEHGTRATAVVSSEPGVKKFQARQLCLGRLLKCLAQEWVANEIISGGIPIGSRNEQTGKMEPMDGYIEFQFPEIAVEDRSSKLKDIDSSKLAGYISKRRAATMSAKELGIEDYNFEEEEAEISEEGVDEMSSLYAVNAALGKPTVGLPPAATSPAEDPQPAASGSLSGQDRRDIKRNDRR